MPTRRRVLQVLGTAALGAAVPFSVCLAQARKVWRVAFLSSQSRADLLRYEGFVSGMRELGYVEGKNLAIELHFADGDRERLARLAAEAVRSKPDVIVTVGSYATRAAKQATADIPIVMGGSSDPVTSGLVASLAQPGGNVTGLSLNAVDVTAKHLELVKAVLPKASLVGVLNNPAIPAHLAAAGTLQGAAPQLGMTVLEARAGTVAEIQQAFTTMKKAKVQAVIVVVDAFFDSHRRRIAELAASNRLPSVFPGKQAVDAGGLLSYGPDRADSFRRAATYVDKIFKGARPADLPVEQPLKLELAVNLRTAKALGVTIPRSLLLQADHVVE